MSSDSVQDLNYLNSSDWELYNSLIGLVDAPSLSYNPLVGSVVGSILVGLSGIFPLLIIPIDGETNFHKGVGANRLKLLLSFAVGSLLGDVFLHLLPEAWNVQSSIENQGADRASDHPSLFCGIWVLNGFLVFTIIEKVLSSKYIEEIGFSSNEVEINCNINSKSDPPSKKSEEKKNTKQLSGYLNLIANVTDNFLHGLSVGGSFLHSPRLGIFCTVTILIHEVPHEVGDFAILLRTGFSRLEAAKAQIWTASSSLFGACAAIYFNNIEAMTSWILPFTAGGFLHIALVTVLPELLQEQNPRESIKQLTSLIFGVLITAFMATIVE